MIDASVGGKTVSMVELLTPFFAAAMVLLPAATPVANPEPPIIAAPAFEEVHVT